MAQKNKQPLLIIAGPCAVETESQLHKTIENIYKSVDIIRAGVWKARTSPKAYSGRGEESLNWLNDIQNKYHTPVAIEVGTPKHIELALKRNIRIFWLGARTTANPFSVEEISESLRGLDVEVWIKNPIFSDIKLWFGAIERFHAIGIKQLKAIHRGFYSEKKMIYRNHPRWDLLNEFKMTYSDIPIICDPSHISGNSNLIYDISKRAIKEGVNGLMIEVHNSPSKALSDKIQQMNPLEFLKVLDEMGLKKN